MKRSKSYEGVFAYGSALLFALSCLLNATLLFAQNPPSGISSSPVSEEVTTPEAATVQVTTTAPGNVSIDFKDADIGNVLRILSLKSQVNIVAGPEVKGTVTIRLEDVPWEKALDVVLRTYGYVYEREGNIVRVTTKENLSTEELATETFILNYTTAVEAETAIKDILSERGRIKSVPRTNMLVVTDIPTNLYKIREVIRKLDKSTPQAHIDSKIVKTQIQKGENLGITWAPGVTAIGAERPTTFPFTAERRREDRDFFEAVFGRFYPQIADTANTHAFDTTGFPRPADAITNQGGGNLFTLGTLDFTSFSAVLQFLRTRAHTKVISNPRITVLNNQVASVKVTKDVPYPTYERNETTGSFEISGYDFKSSGVQMKVTPHINDASEILVDLQPEVTSISSTDVTTFTTSTAAALQSLPNINVTTAVTQVLIKSGETIAIGGLMTDSVATTEQKVPFFGDIPLIGKIFRSKDSDQGSSNEKVETLFFVTVTIVDTEGEAVVAPSPQPGTAAAAGNAGPAQTPLTIQSGNVEKI